MGASILISQSVGARKREDIGEYAGAMMKYNNIIPIFLCFFWLIFPKPVFMILGVSDSVMPLCLGYVRWYAPLFLLTGLGGSLGVILQTSNYTKPLMVYGCVRPGLNMFLDWMLIFGNFGMPALGIEGAAIATVIAEYEGITLCAYAVCAIVTVVMIVGAVLFPEQILSLFTSDKTVIASCGVYLLLIGINLFSKFGNIIIGNAIRGSGNTKWMLFTQIFGTIWIVSVASVLVFICKLGILGVFLAVLLDEGVRVLINFWKYLRIVKKWRE